jgi:hypothetical protein
MSSTTAADVGEGAAKKSSTEATPRSPDIIYDHIYADLGRAYESVGAERRWTVEGAIEDIPVVLLVGPEKRGKSWMLCDLVVAVTTATKWLGAFQVPPDQQGRVCVIDGEYGPWEYSRRIARLARGRGIDPKEVFAKIDYVYGWQFMLEAGNGPYLQVVGDIKKKKPSVVIVDPLRNFLDGDENSTTDALNSFRLLTNLRVGCPVVVAAHLNKRGTMSGARALKTRADMIIEGTDEEQPGTRRSGGSCGRRTRSPSRSRSGSSTSTTTTTWPRARDFGCGSKAIPFLARSCPSRLSASSRS